MILYYLQIAKIQQIRHSVEMFTEVMYACICICSYFTIALFTGLIQVYPAR